MPPYKHQVPVPFPGKFLLALDFFFLMGKKKRILHFTFSTCTQIKRQASINFNGFLLPFFFL